MTFIAPLPIVLLFWGLTILLAMWSYETFNA